MPKIPKVLVTLVNGPCAGPIEYSSPLPHTLVVAAKTEAGPRWHDYTQTRSFNKYVHSTECKCHG